MPVAQRFVLDSITASPVLACSFRRLYTSFVGPSGVLVREPNGIQRNIFFDSQGNSDQNDMINFACNGQTNIFGSATLATWKNQTGGADLTAPNNRLQVVNLGQVNTNNGLPFACQRGTSRMVANSPSLLWSRQLVINIVLVRGDTPTTDVAFIASADWTGSTFRDCELFTPVNSTTLGWGQDLNTMTPNTSTVNPNTVQVITVIRNPVAINGVWGQIRQNGRLTSSLTSNNVTVDSDPNRFNLFANPDAGGFNVVGQYPPNGWGVQEVMLFNSATPMSETELALLERDQCDYYGAPYQGATNVALTPNKVGNIYNLPLSNGIGARVGGASTNLLNTNNGQYIAVN